MMVSCTGPYSGSFSAGRFAIYGKSGTVPALLEEYGLTAQHIYEEAKKAVSMKK